MYSNGGFGWSWLLWVGFLVIIFSSFGHWGYSYRMHRRYGAGYGASPKGALDILDERYARGEITHDEYGRMKSEIMRPPVVTPGR